jgi:uncharacterized protein (TIGR02145 family)
MEVLCFKRKNKSNRVTGYNKLNDMNRLIILIIAVAFCTSCKTSKSFTDPRDNKSYSIAKIKGLWWTTQNMNFEIDGSQYYNYEQANARKSGKMYNWEQAQQVCPPGWRLPTDKELIDLFLPYGKISYSGESEGFKKIFGPYAPEKTEATYFKLIEARNLNIPEFDRSGVEDQRTMLWSSVSSGEERAFAIYWRSIDQYIEYNSVHFSDYPKYFFGFCRCVKQP